MLCYYDHLYGEKNLQLITNSMELYTTGEATNCVAIW
jgi:hypothetical protein